LYEYLYQIDSAMDLMIPDNQNKEAKPVTALLTLPRSELHRGRNASQQEQGQPKQFVLMQLAKGMELSDLVKESRFVAPPTDNNDNSSNNNNNNHRMALVVESTNQSFLLHRLETSNVLVLVPPAADSAAATAAADDDDEPVSKKAKMDEMDTTLTLVPVKARLLTPGVSSGSSFLELRPKILRPSQLAPLLANHVFDPYHHHHNSHHHPNQKQQKNPYRKSSHAKQPEVGRTVESLALELQCSRGQVYAVLTTLHSFPFPTPQQQEQQQDSNMTTTTTYYGVLSEEALQEAQEAINATLMEDSSGRFQSYDLEGVVVADFIPAVLERIPANHTHPYLDHVIRYAMARIIANPSSSSSSSLLSSPFVVVNQDQVTFSVDKIARRLAHLLFQQQQQHLQQQQGENRRPWSRDKFLLKWQAAMPGIGSRYVVHSKMLRGIAIDMVTTSTSRQEKEEEEGEDHPQPYLQYLPADHLPPEPAKRFEALFAVREQWMVDELEPYLETLVEDSGMTLTEILIQYATSCDDEKTGDKVYKAKK
jgi:Sister chromatid cohesion protein Dcc1